MTSSEFTDEWHHYKVEFECGSGNHYGLDQYEYKVYLDNSSYGVFEMNGTPSTLNELKFSTWTTNDTIFYADAVGFSWDGNYTIGDNYEDTNITSWNSYFTTKLNGSLPELMNLHSDVLRLIPWLANYKNSQQGNKPQGFSEWMKQKLEEFRDFVVGMFAWLAAALEDLKEMLEEVLDAIMLNLLEWLLYLIWLMIRAALLVIIYIFFAFTYLVSYLIIALTYSFLILFQTIFTIDVNFENGKLTTTGELEMELNLNAGFNYFKLLDLEYPMTSFNILTENVVLFFSMDFFDADINIDFIKDIFQPQSSQLQTSAVALESAEYALDLFSQMGDIMTMVGGFVAIHMGVLTFASSSTKEKGIFVAGLVLYVVAFVLYLILLYRDASSSAYFGIFLGFLLSGLWYFYIYLFLRSQYKTGPKGGDKQYMYNWKKQFGLYDFTRVDEKSLARIFAVLEGFDMLFSGIDIFWKIRDTFTDIEISPLQTLIETRFSVSAGLLSNFIAGTLLVTVSSNDINNKKIFALGYSISCLILSIVWLCFAVNALNNEIEEE